MTTTAPPRPPRPSDPVDRQQVEALVEALFEEARQRARRRRRVRLAIVACVLLMGATLLAVFERTAESQSASPAFTAGAVRLWRQGQGRHRWHQRPHLPRRRMEASRERAPSRPPELSPTPVQSLPTVTRACGWDVDHSSLRRQGQEGHDHIRGQDRHECRAHLDGRFHPARGRTRACAARASSGRTPHRPLAR